MSLAAVAWPWDTASAAEAVQNHETPAGEAADSTDAGKIVHGVLGNGLQYEIYVSRSEPGRAAIAFALEAGTDQEGPQEQDFAHLSEHLIVEGRRSKAHPELTGFSLADFWGGGTGVGDAQTLPIGTYVLRSVLLERAPGLVDPLEVFRTFLDYAPSEAEIATAARSIVGEMEKDDSKERAITLDLQRQLGRQRLDIVAERANMSSVDREKLGGFYRRYYRPDLTTIIIRGDVNPLEIEATIKRLFGDAKNVGPKPAVERRIAPDPKLAIVTSTGAHRTRASLVIRFGQSPDPEPVEFDDPVMREKLSMIISGRLEPLFRRYSPAAESFSAFTARRSNGDVGHDLVVSVSNCVPAAVRACIIDALEPVYNIAKFGATPEEIGAFADDVSRRPTTPEPDNFALVRERLLVKLGVSRTRPIVLAGDDDAAVMRTLRKLLADERLIVEVSGPPTIEPLTRQDVEEAIGLARTKGEAAAFVRGEGQQISLRRAPRVAEANISVNWHEAPLAHIAEVSWRNGPPVTMLFTGGPSPASGYRIFATSSGRTGTQRYGEKDIRIALDLVANQGVGGLDRFKLEDWLREEGLYAAQYVVANRSVIAIDVRDEGSTDEAAGLLRAYFDVDSVDPAALADFLAREDGLKAASRAVDGALDGKRLLEAYRSIFGSPRDFLYIISGELDAEARDRVARALAATILNTTATRDPLAVIRPPFTTGKRDKVPADTQIAVALRWSVPARVEGIAGAILDQRLSTILTLRMVNRLRMQENGVYWTESSLRSNASTGVASGTIAFSAMAETADRLIRAALDELAIFKAGNFSADEWAQLVAPVQGAALSRMSDAELADAYLGVRGDLRRFASLRLSSPDRAAIRQKLDAIPTHAKIDVEIEAR